MRASWIAVALSVAACSAACTKKDAEVVNQKGSTLDDFRFAPKSAAELVTKLKVKPEDNPTSESLKKGGQDNVAKLKKLDGAAFDRAYVDHEVTYHETVLDALDKTLIPSATNDELKALMVKVRPAFVAHLEHAKQLQASLGRSGG